MRIRSASPETDIPGIAAVVNAFEREPVNSAVIRQWFEHMPPGRIAHRRVAVDERDEVTGYSVVVHESWQPEGDFYVWVGVLPDWRRQGIGSALQRDLRAFLKEQGAVRLKSEVRDDDPFSLQFGERNGFSIDRHLFASRLDLQTFDESLFERVIPVLEGAGINFCSMKDFEDSVTTRRKLYELNRVTSLDIPGIDDATISFEEFEQWVFHADTYDPAGQLIALEGENWVGLSAIKLLPETQGAYNAMTGVLRAYRGRKIGLALKLLAIRYARDRGVQYLSTDNDSLNRPMLAINRKLGYQPQPGRYILCRE